MPILTAGSSFAELSLTAVLGYAVVFLGIVLLMIVITIVGKFFTKAKKAAPVPVAAPVETPAVPDAPVAPGTAGQLKLHNVDPKTAAILMAIVADKLGKPLNELRFISIKEVE